MKKILTLCSLFFMASVTLFILTNPSRPQVDSSVYKDSFMDDCVSKSSGITRIPVTYCGCAYDEMDKNRGSLTVENYHSTISEKDFNRIVYKCAALPGV